VSLDESIVPAATIDALWDELVSTALLGTDRRDPPSIDGPVADLAADLARSSPPDRMLAQVAACVAVRRAGFTPGPARPPLAAPPADERPIIVPAAADRWRHITVSWPVLEDEWTLASIQNGWRVAPELVPAMLRRHRRDPVRRARVLVAAGPVADWLVELLPDHAGARPLDDVSSEEVAELPTLPIPPDLARLIGSPGAESGRVLAASIKAGELGPAHRAVLVNLVARVLPASLPDLARLLGAVDPLSPGHGLTFVLADLATTRARMLDELRPC